MTDTTLTINPRAALDAAIDGARLASPKVAEIAGIQHLLVPQGYKLEAVQDPDRLPSYVRSTSVTVDQRASFVTYTNRFSDDRTILIADYDTGTISAALDWHAEGPRPAPQPRQHTCKLKLRDSEEFSRWNKMQGKMVSQAEFAAFLEENAVDVVDPEPAVLIEISRDLEATQGVTFKSSTRLESGDRAFVYETETKTRGDIKVPREFTLAIPLYNGEDTTELRCALRFKVEAGGLLLGFEWRRVEYQRQAYFAAVATAAAEETGRPVIFGRVA